MKKLKKILLVNWLYFSRQVIEVDDINFLTGKNGAGKSTVIDALQIVLLGDTNSRNFNQAANEKSQRTLDGYLRADMDPNNPYSRRGKDFTSYIACEFFDDMVQTGFVTGVAFDCRSDGNYVDHFFIYNGAIPENGFVENGLALDYPMFRKKMREQYGTQVTFYETQKQYRADMLAKWNVHDEQVMRMMKKAVSFRPIVDIQKFITENICDVSDKPDIIAMQQNIRAYKRHEKLARQQEEKLNALRAISGAYEKTRQAMSDWQMQDFLVRYAQIEDLENQCARLRKEKTGRESDIQKHAARLEELGKEIRQAEEQRDTLVRICAQSDVSREKDKLRADCQTLEREQRRLESQLQKGATDLKREARCILGIGAQLKPWEDRQELLGAVSAAKAAEACYAPFEDCGGEIFGGSREIFEAAQEATQVLLAKLRDEAYGVKVILDDWKRRRDEGEKALANLRRNVKNYPKGLLPLKEKLESELTAHFGKTVRLEILADVLEIPEAEERWRHAVEGYLSNQKFYLLADPEYYEEAVRVYDRIKRSFGPGSFGLVDIGKLRQKERPEPQPDSLAKKVSTENDLARSYADYLLGRVICCEEAEDLRRHKTAITPEGLLYQGYVVRPLRAEQMEEAYIGRRAVALRLAQIEEEVSKFRENMKAVQPLYEVLSKAQTHEPLISARYVQSTLREQSEDCRREKEITGELKKAEEKLSRLDLFWLEEQEKAIDTLEETIDTLRKEELRCSGEKALAEARVTILETEEIPGLTQRIGEQKEGLDAAFSTDFVESAGLPRYAREKEKLKNAAGVVRRYSATLEDRKMAWEDARKQLLQKRMDYQRFGPCSFRVDAEDNREYAAEERFLEESELPQYRQRIRAAYESAMEQFQNDFLAKLKSSIDQVQGQVKSLNRALEKAQFGTDRYRFRVERNPDYGQYYDMIMAPELMEGEGGLFALPFQQKYGQLIEELFGRIAMSDDTQLNARRQSELQENIEKYTDFRTYLKFDLETTDQNGAKQLLSQTLNTKSGGETQTPFYIAVLASFAQLYQVNNLSGVVNNTVRLVVFDEAFNKMDSERIVESVRLLRKMGLQAIICTPPDKLSDIMPLADRTLLVGKDKYKMHVLSYAKENREVK